MSLNWIVTLLSMVLTLATTAISFYAFHKRKQADNHLIKLFEKEKIDSISLPTENLEASKALEELQTELEALIGSHKGDTISEEVHKYILERQVQALRLQLLRKQVLELSKKLSKSDRDEVLEAINQDSEEGRANYLNRILEQSKSFKGIQYH